MARDGCIWVTRAQPGADATAARLLMLGHEPLVASLLEVRLLPPSAEPPSGFAALAFTSANAVRAFADWTPLRAWPVFAVGAATAAVARTAGFRDVSSADGDVEALARCIAAARPSGPVLHPCAREAAGDLARALEPARLRVQAAPLYETCSVERLPASASAALERGDVAVALVHSPKGARALAQLCTAAAWPALKSVELLGLSAACLEPAAHLPFASAYAPAQPHETSMLELL